MDMPNQERLEELKTVKEMVINIARQAMWIQMEDVEEILNLLNREHAIAPIIDPTGYNRDYESINMHKELLRGIIPFLKVIKRVQQNQRKHFKSSDLTD